MSLFEYLNEPEHRKDLAQFIEKRIPELVEWSENESKLNIVQRNDYFVLICEKIEKSSEDFSVLTSYNIRFFNNDSDFTNFRHYDVFSPDMSEKFIKIINQYKRKIKLKEINGKSI